MSCSGTPASSRLVAKVWRRLCGLSWPGGLQASAACETPDESPGLGFIHPPSAIVEEQRSARAIAERHSMDGVWGSKKPQPVRAAVSQRVEWTMASEPATVQEQLRYKSELINGMVDHLPAGDGIIALCSGGPGSFGEHGPMYGVYVLTSRELLWRNDDGQSLEIALDDVQEMQTTYVSQHCVYITLAMGGGHETELALAYSKHSSGKRFYEALNTAIRTVRESRKASTASPRGSVADELEKLAGLLQRGVLTQAEFESESARFSVARTTYVRGAERCRSHKACYRA
jgi:hypothetical protein